MFRILYKNFGQNPFLIEDREKVEHVPKNQDLSLVSWNVYKFKKKASREDLKEISDKNHFVSLQEIVYGPSNLEYFRDIIRLNWVFAFSFFRSFKDKTKTGVVNGSVFESVQIGYLESTPKVPIIQAPKMAVFTKYKIEGSKDHLMVLNVHVINFAGNKKFDIHLAQISQLLEAHSGPVILAGDFNTWNWHRIDFLKKMSEENSLSETQIENESRFRKFDHIFTRGVDVKKYKLMDHVKSSDHTPVHFLFQLK